MLTWPLHDGNVWAVENAHQNKIELDQDRHWFAKQTHSGNVVFVQERQTCIMRILLIHIGYKICCVIICTSLMSCAKWSTLGYCFILRFKTCWNTIAPQVYIFIEKSPYLNFISPHKFRINSPEMFVAGGFKVWECSVDLIGFLSLHQFVFKDKLVLEVLFIISIMK